MGFVWEYYYQLSAGDLYDLFDTMSEQFIMWPERGLQKKATGMHEVDTNSLVLAKIDALAKQMEAMKYSHSANMVQMPPPICVTCGANHQSSECPLTKVEMPSPEQAAYAQNFQR
ncbi:Uncharacterized protein Adt_04852 [Abeliophyllum distichum]|uniref:Retrotransposon gag protein n=1 Tax=Abeliophyllum distichum TaxID=126358 RepID=A0ABD1V2U1_9LAMI